jgi:hypothetical protein
MKGIVIVLVGRIEAYYSSAAYVLSVVYNYNTVDGTFSL